MYCKRGIQNTLHAGIRSKRGYIFSSCNCERRIVKGVGVGITLLSKQCLFETYTSGSEKIFKLCFICYGRLDEVFGNPKSAY